VCFGLVVAGKYLAGMAEVAHVVAIGLGLALVALEILAFPGTLWLGLTGGLLAAGGLVAASLGGGFSLSEPLGRERLLDTALSYSLAAAGAVVVALLVSRWLPRAPLLSRMVLAPEGAGFAGALPESGSLPAVGALGTALTDLRPVGKVEVEGRRGIEFEARSQGVMLARGERVRVIETAEGRLVVERAEAAR
jgi:membrane-bound serine protease (ClpP class)